MITLFSGKDLELRYDDRGGEECFITFTSWGSHTQGFGERLFTSRGISACYFVSHRNHWWQTAEAPKAVDLLKEVLANASYRRLVTYGASMGGYGAAMYSRRLQADAAILIAPQFSIDGRKVPFEARWRQEASSLNFLWDDMAAALSPDLRYYALFDPKTDDRRHVELFSRHAAIKRIPMPYGGHTPGLVLRESGLLPSFVFDVVNGTFDALALRRKIRQGRAKSPTYLSGLSRAIQGRSVSTAERVNRMALDLAPNNAVYVLRAVDLALLTNQLDVAQILAERAVDVAPDHPAPWRAMSRTYLLRGRFDEAVSAAQNAVSRRPKDADLQRVLLEALIRAQRLEESVAVAEVAIALAPRYAHTWSRYALVLERLGRRFAAIAVLKEACELGLRDERIDERLEKLGGVRLQDGASRCPDRAQA